MLPEVTLLALSEVRPFRTWDELDRIIIYTDGTSNGKLRWTPPLQAEDQGHADCWAFVALGEVYQEDSSSELVFIGWTAQPVRYEKECAHYLGANRIGSEIAEREGLCWAGLWRLGIDSSLPTIFRSDSLTTAGQALGTLAAKDPDDS